jgi:hypothetical protein
MYSVYRPSKQHLKWIIICRYIFLRFRLKARFASTKFCGLYVEVVQGRRILMFYMYVANVSGYKICAFFGQSAKISIIRLSTRKK